ncbi:hypothetical protein GPECTOR_1g662 [Gonium pectorale]|uniref:Plastid division protein CDP1-like 1st alpha solenoid domain-containing protein n=1 Tax=Gonium pectorale TaxID=33097 RepID=A0A150H3X7_GONPE|nr:hypothetical protein GPECTOR_1g662 [Gonium pectorale]|eukprot:KXZ56735.1 hypothetical protein GPECTOR_1g662 [Gonium pectorale]
MLLVSVKAPRLICKAQLCGFRLKGRRLEVLDYVRREIINSKGRARESRELSLPLDLLPGALALMTEVGQCQLALDIGTELMGMSETVPEDVRRDVLLSMALANCGLASESLEGNNAQLAQGCNYLEAALQHLETAGEPSLAPTLATQIRHGLSSLRVQGAMEQLSGPVEPSTADVRKRAIRVIRDAIRTQNASVGQQPSDALGLSLGLAVGGAARGQVGSAISSGAGAAVTGSTAVTPELMETLMSVLTSEEVVELLEWEQVAQNPAACKW